MERYKDVLIAGSAIPTFATGFDWYSQGTIFRRGHLGSIVEIRRISGGIFKSKEEAERDDLNLCKSWINKRLDSEPNMLPTLTPRQKEIYDFVLKAIRANGYAPSIPEIGAKFKIASTNGGFRSSKGSRKEGLDPTVGKRAIEVLSSLGKPVLSSVRDIPILGKGSRWQAIS
jgi:LexA DNA binding domain